MAERIGLVNATIFDGTGRDPYGPATLVIEGNRIMSVGPTDQISVPREAQVFDMSGHTVMPGLIDAHTHLHLIEATFWGGSSQFPGATYAYLVARNIERTLLHGFTTIRDAGGLDPSFKFAKNRGLFKGPRMYISCSSLSQTGGHSDFRNRHERGCPAAGHPLEPPPGVCDGVDQVRQVAREQLRSGADQIKIMAGGGAASPTDLLDTPQFTVEEIAAAVYEARAVKKSVMAHVYVPEGIKNCAKAGVHSIEHGNFIDEESAFIMKEQGMYLVPTLSAYELLSRYGRGQGVPEPTMEKLEVAKGAAEQGLEIGLATGLRIGSGSDIYGPNGDMKGLEIALKASVMGSTNALVSATRTNADMIGMGDELGTLEPGKLADLIAVHGDPVTDVSVLQDEQKIAMVFLDGQQVKGPGYNWRFAVGN